MLKNVESASENRGLQSLIPYAYIFRAMLLYAGFFLLPALWLIYLSLHQWTGMGERSYIGFNNYRDLVGDDMFWLALRHNVAWVLAAMVVPVCIGLALAILLARSPMRGRVVFRVIYFVPQVLSSIAVAVIWSWIYNPTFGALNQFLGAIGLESLQRGWLGDANLALPALFVVWTWIYYGFTMVIFVAALESIDEMLFEAAKIDGAVWHQQIRHVLLPAIRGPLTTILLVTAITAFQVFDIIFALTNGGPGRATLVLPLYMLDSAFTFRKIGYGAAIAVALGGLILVFSLLLLRIRSTFQEELPGE